MIYEIAEIRVKPDMGAQFEIGVAQAAPLFKRAKGCVSMRLQRVIEDADTYRLVVGWETVENHMVDFRGSEDFQEWRRLVEACFLTPPSVRHTTTVLTGF